MSSRNNRSRQDRSRDPQEARSREQRQERPRRRQQDPRRNDETRQQVNSRRGNGVSSSSNGFMNSSHHSAHSSRSNDTSVYHSRDPNDSHHSHHSHHSNPSNNVYTFSSNGNASGNINVDIQFEKQNRSTDVLDIPVWKESEESYSMSSPKPERARARSSISRVVQTISVNEAFRLIDSGVEAENEDRFAAACQFFCDAADMLFKVSQHEQDRHISSLLTQKANECLEWSDNLFSFEQGGCVGPVPRRYGKHIEVDLTDRIRKQSPLMGRDQKEAVTLHYTACSSKEVINYTNDGYRLQCNLNRRNPRLMVVITMYNEDESELNNTLRKVSKNIKYIQKKELPGYTGDDAWKNILVVVVSDGRTKANKGTLNFLKNICCFDEDAMNITMKGVDVNCHIFEYSPQLVRNEKGALSVGGDSSSPPLQIVFALKENNSGKLSSHEWYFNAFAEQIQPDYTILLDVGTLPTESAFYRLLSSMELNDDIGGTCGEIAVDQPIPNLCNWVIAAQHFEYKISNILDKSLESVFGFISVLPGAFSAYRYKAIRGAPLEAYFKSLTTPMHKLGPFQGNMYLAEDRILCFELLARRDCKWKMAYIKNAIARTDVPPNLVALIGQRRRWLNGSFFALLYTILNWGRVYTQSRHSVTRKFFLFIQYAYMVVNIALTWILPANFFLVTYFLVIVGLENNNWVFVDTTNISDSFKQSIVVIFFIFYGISYLIQLVAGLGNKPKHIKWVYRMTAIFYGLITYLTFIIATAMILDKMGILEYIKGFDSSAFKNFSTLDVFSIVISIGVFFIASALHCELHHIVFSFLQYTFLLPTFVNVFNFYSFCNLHDLSWGTKGLESAEGHGAKSKSGGKKYKDAIEAQQAEEERKKKEAEIKDKMEGDFQYWRSKLLILWIVSQIGFTYVVVTYDDKPGQEGFTYLSTLFAFVAVFNSFRLIGSVLYIFEHYADRFGILCSLKSKMRKKQKKKERRERREQERQRQYERHETPAAAV